MNKARNFTILKESWKKCEEVVKGLAEGYIDKNEWNKSELKNILTFLGDIGFQKDGELIEKGEEHYKCRFVLKDEKEAKNVVTESLKSYEPVQIICQILWGRENLDRESLYRLLLLERCISPEFKFSDLGGFLMLLNYCGILKYSKGTKKITILYNPKIENEDKPTKRFLSPETPYSNIKALRESLRKCKEYIWWFDKHFSPKGFEPLAEEADGTKIKEIRILTGLTDNVNDKLKRDFTRFQKEIRNRGIDVELRVICEKNLFHDIHDRWIISKNICLNMPPINSIYKGQYAEIKETENTPPFEDWWQKGSDLVNDWQSILTKKSKI